MHLDELTQLMLMLVSSLLLTTLFHRLKQPTIVAYIAVGCVLGPSVLGLVNEAERYSLWAEFGVVFLLFTLGLEFSFARLMGLKRAVFVLGGAQVLLCCALFGVAFYAWGTTAAQALVLASLLTFSSTAIVTKLLSDSGSLGLPHARLSIGILLFQDLAAIAFLVLVPSLAGDTAVLLPALASALGKAAILIAILVVVGRWVLPKLYTEVARSASAETFVLVTLVIVVVAAWLMHLAHLSMALGGFVIGMMLGSSAFKHQIEQDIKPFKDLLLGLFFIAVGLQIDISLLLSFPHRIVLAVLALALVKAVLIAAMAVILGESKRVAVQAGLVLAHAGEFGFALVAVAGGVNLLPADVVSFMILVMSLSMLTSPLVIAASTPITARLFKASVVDQPTAAIEPECDHVIIGGYGRLGTTLAALLEENQQHYIVLDHDARLVNAEREAGNKHLYFGDCTQLKTLQAAGVERAALVVLSLHEVSQAASLVSLLRQHYPDLPIIVRARHESAYEELVLAGADHVVPEMLEASLTIASHALQLLGVAQHSIFEQLQRIRLKH